MLYTVVEILDNKVVASWLPPYENLDEAKEDCRFAISCCRKRNQPVPVFSIENSDGTVVDVIRHEG